jgi:uncharacterized protein YqgV (UPF0045/DUF77 family)
MPEIYTSFPVAGRAGKKITIGAVPGALILANDVGEVFTVENGMIDEVVSCIQRMAQIAKKMEADTQTIKVENWPRRENKN